MGRREAYTEFWWRNLRERDHLGELSVDGRIILKWIFKKWDRSLDWNDLVQDKDRSRFLANAVKNLRVP
jgi:hypothetical protein